MDYKIKQMKIEKDFRVIDIYSHFIQHGHKHINTNEVINQLSLQFSTTTLSIKIKTGGKVGQSVGIIALTIENELETVIKEGGNKMLRDMKIEFMLLSIIQTDTFID